MLFPDLVEKSVKVQTRLVDTSATGNVKCSLTNGRRQNRYWKDNRFMEQLRKTLLDIIAWDAEVRFVVPKYQRHYIWSDKEIARMWDDWRDVCDRPLKHFCGVMLFRKLADEGPLSWEIVDGQQRMTTFFIFFIALRDFCAANDIDFSQLSHVFTTEDADECRLQLLVGTSDDRYVLNALLKRQPDSVEQGIKTKSHVWEAYSFFTTQGEPGREEKFEAFRADRQKKDRLREMAGKRSIDFSVEGETFRYPGTIKVGKSGKITVQVVI